MALNIQQNAVLLLALLNGISAKPRLTPSGAKAYALFMRSFAAALRNSGSCPPNVHILDVGANDGGFTIDWFRRFKKLPCWAQNATRMHVTLVEPQPRFHRRLTLLADDIGGRYIPLAAWSKNTTLTFAEHSDARWKHSGVFTSQSFGVVNSAEEDAAAPAADTDAANPASTTSAGGSAPVRFTAFDLAEYIARVLPKQNATSGKRDAFALLKIDVEGVVSTPISARWPSTRQCTLKQVATHPLLQEYNLLPHLLTSGVLCRVSHLLVEWHLARVEKERRLAAISLRHALRLLLERGCTVAPHVSPLVRVRWCMTLWLTHDARGPLTYYFTRAPGAQYTQHPAHR